MDIIVMCFVGFQFLSLESFRLETSSETRTPMKRKRGSREEEVQSLCETISNASNGDSWQVGSQSCHPSVEKRVKISRVVVLSMALAPERTVQESFYGIKGTKDTKATE
jgi:hypothetical protein